MDDPKGKISGIGALKGVAVLHCDWLNKKMNKTQWLDKRTFKTYCYLLFI